MPLTCLPVSYMTRSRYRRSFDGSVLTLFVGNTRIKTRTSTFLRKGLRTRGYFSAVVQVTVNDGCTNVLKLRL